MHGVELSRYEARRERVRDFLVKRVGPIMSAVRLHRMTVSRHQRVFMVVGSYGKTTTTRAVRAALGLPDGRWWHANANACGEIGLSLLRAPPWQRRVVIETAIGAPDAMRRYASLLRPDVAIVTAIGHEHVRAFRDQEHLRFEKAEAVRGLSHRGTAILNHDDPHVRWMAGQTRARVVWYGTTPACDVWAESVRVEWPRGTRFRLHAFGAVREVRIRLLGVHFVRAVLAAVVTACVEGRPLDAALAALALLPPTHGRLEPIALPSGATLIRDDYKSTPDTIAPALRVLAEAPARRRWVVIGDLNNLPSSPAEAHYEAAGAAVGRVADEVLVVGTRLPAYLPGLLGAGLAPERIRAAADVHAAAEVLRDALGPGDVVLLKGYEDQRLMRIALLLEGEAVRCTREICTMYLKHCADCPFRTKATGSR